VIVSAHQPHFLPWLGYLHKLALADLFVVMDDLQYEAQNFQNRNRVKVNNGACWLTVPLVRGTQRDRICDKLIDNSASPRHHWAHRAWETLRTHYGKAPYFGVYAPQIEALFARRWDRLLDLDLEILRSSMRWFGIEVPLVLASSLGLRGEKTARILDLCKKVGASTYLSGSGASRDYLDTGLLERSGVELAWQHFAHPVYEQRYAGHGFVSHLSALDLLFNCGPSRGRALLLQQCDEAEPAAAAGGAP
jgi:hypothetical protein